MPQLQFVGREHEKELYKEFLSRKIPWVLVITGPVGGGTSKLLHQLHSEYTPVDACAVLLDFTDDSLRKDPLKILAELSRQVKPYCDKLQYDEFNNILRGHRHQLSQPSTYLINEMTQNLNAGHEATLTGTQFTMSLTDAMAIEERRHQVRELVTEALYAQMDTFSLVQLIIMLDNCEWLGEPEYSEIGQWMLNELVPGLHTRLQERYRFFVVIASRIKPQLEIIDRDLQLFHSLPLLNSTEVDEYLIQAGMQNAELRQQIFDLINGHALCMSIICEIWREQGPFTIEDLPRLEIVFRERALNEFFQNRIYNRLKSPFRELIRYGSLFPTFDFPLLQAVFHNELSLNFDQFSKLISYPYVIFVGDRYYALFGLLRELLAEKIRQQEPEKWRLYHERALDYFALESEQSQRPLSPNWYYHALALNEEQGMLAWKHAVEQAGTYEQLKMLLVVVQDRTLKLRQSLCDEARSLVYQRENRLRESEALHLSQDRRRIHLLIPALIAKVLTLLRPISKAK